MSKPLIIVESPTKVRTIKKYLGNDYNVVATVGHIKDLPPKEMGIDIENDFKPTYTTIPGKRKIVTALRKAAAGSEIIYLAPDPDREGEAIAWHAAQILSKKGRQFLRVLFHELTKKALNEAMKNPLDLSASKYEAQQARRILDRLVGYQISPLLWRKVKGGLSAGRVQSVSVRIICERERAIQAFESQEYWSITAHLEADNPPPFTAKLVKKNNRKLAINNQKEADDILKRLSSEPFIVDKIQNKKIRRNPQPPFITSKLQQEAIHKLHFSARKTMMVAQQLYEGIDLGPGEPQGLITYMRTDSTRIAGEAALEAMEFIRKKYGKDYALEKPRFFKNRKSAQDAHEAIRPTSVFNTPEKIASYLSKDQLLLYRQIWRRFVASQMQQALISQNRISIKAADYNFSASGSTILFPGFMSLYMSTDESNKQAQATSKDLIPPLTQGMALNLTQLLPKQHFTQPPPRFSEASLVKELEENGIGRPSTYAAILTTIRNKGYVILEKRYFRPSELGFIVNDLLVQNFPDILDVEFTAKMETNLDRVEASDINCKKLLSDFYASFSTELEAAKKEMLSMKGVGFTTAISCPDCGRTLNIKVGKNGHFLACQGYPDCKYSSDYKRDEKGDIKILTVTVSEDLKDQKCSLCNLPMVLKRGRYGQFLACSGYPKCKHTQSLNGTNGSGKDTGVKCPQTDCDGTILERSSKRGKIFYGCSRYPDCTFASWDKPVAMACPQCGNPFLVEKNTKKKGDFIACPKRECSYTKMP